MSLSLTIQELLDYSDSERVRWKEWFAARPEALATPVQPNGEITTAGLLLHHVFQAEDWHAQRLLGHSPVLDETVSQNDCARLFAYGDAVRERLLNYVRAPAADPLAPREFGTPGRGFRMSDRKTLFFLMIHEIRHLAQIALAVRNAGLEPPGRHDLYFSSALE